jgi:hypothetical protein
MRGVVPQVAAQGQEANGRYARPLTFAYAGRKRRTAVKTRPKRATLRYWARVLSMGGLVLFTPSMLLHTYYALPPLTAYYYPRW